MEKSCVQRAVTLAVCSRMAKQGEYFVPAASSARHVHLCRKDIDVLFGNGYQLSELKALTQPGQFASNEKIMIKGCRSEIRGVRVLGPEREQTQVEISMTDSFKLGIKPMVRMSGDIDGSAGAVLIGPAGQVELSQGILISARHLHISPEQAAEYKLKDGDVVSLKKGGARE